jgi:RNA polymerase sigma factor (sigma-70 family)
VHASAHRLQMLAAGSNEMTEPPGEPPGEADDVADDALLRRVARHDRAAFEELYRRHRDKLVAASFRVVGDWHTAEEIVQEALVTVWKRAATFEGRSTVRTWLHAVVRNQSLNHRRRAARVGGVGDAAELVAVPAAEIGPEDAALATAEQAELAAALKELPPAHREVLTLMFVAELSHAEIGQVLGVPIGTVKSRLHAAKRGLAARLRARTAPGQGA